MPPLRRFHRPLALATGLAAALAAALPAAAPAAPRLDVAPDAAAPEGRTPKVVFTLRGTTKNRSYKIEATQLSGQSPLNEQGYPVICTAVVGRFVYEKAKGSKHVFVPTPLTSYELASGSPCTGTYKGKVLQQRSGGRPPKELMTFRLEIGDSMKLTHVRVPR